MKKTNEIDEENNKKSPKINLWLIVLLVSTLAAYTGEGEKDANETRETNKTTNNFRTLDFFCMTILHLMILIYRSEIETIGHYSTIADKNPH